MNTELKSEFIDTYHADLASDKQLFNDRALIRVELPDRWEDVASCRVTSVQAGGQELPHRLVGQTFAAPAVGVSDPCSCLVISTMIYNRREAQLRAEEAQEKSP